MKKSEALFISIFLSTAIVLVNAGCGKKEEAKAPPPAPSAEAKAPQITPPAQPPQPAPTQAPQVAAPTAAPAAAPAAPASKALATAEGEHTGVRVEVLELKRSSDGTVMLRFALINESNKAFDMDDLRSSTNNNFDPCCRNASGVHLVDGAGKKKYLVLRDTERNCVCSRNVSDVRPGSRTNLWAKFPAPPDNVQKIGIVIPHFTPMDDMPLSR